MLQTEIRAPFKWAGGKTRQLRSIRQYFPETAPRDQHYFEPFLGAGSIFLDRIMTWKGNNITFVGADLNDALINFWTCLQFDVETILKFLQNDINLQNFAHKSKSKRRQGYLYARNIMNQTAHDRKDKDDNAPDFEYATMFYYIMRNCFAGIWRQNDHNDYDNGLGNPPRTLVDTSLLREIHSLLRSENVIFIREDCFETISFANKKDVIYGDPPYDLSTVVYNNKLQEQLFQRDLAFAFNAAVYRGVQVLHSNSNTALIRALYVMWDKHLIPIGSRIGNNSNEHNDELLITHSVPTRPKRSKQTAPAA